VTGIGEGAFYGCESLTDVFYAGTEAQWQAIDADEGNEPLSTAAIHYAFPPAADFVLPASLTAIGEEAFAGGAFTRVQLSEGVTAIGSRAFADCPQLAYIYIPAATDTIAEDAFAGVDGLTILGHSESYAALYALLSGIAFAAVD